MYYYAIDLESFAFDPRYARLSPQERKRLDDDAVVRQTESLLELLDKHTTKLTFFVLGEILEWHPDLIASIAAEGHEIGYHTHNHPRLDDKQTLARELELSRELIRLYGPKGFQAPAVVFPKDGYACLAASGFRYSSSVYSARPPFHVDGILEIPVSSAPYSRTIPELEYPTTLSLALLRHELPIGSSYFLRLLGWRRVSRFISSLEKENRSANLFMHNWQLFERSPRERSNFLRGCLRNPLTIPYGFRVLREFECLLQEHRFVRMDTALARA